MLTELCQELRNWFDRERHFGTFEISGGVLTAPFLVDGQYYRIIGSIFNDGVHKRGDANDVLRDETFDGAVWTMALPVEVLQLSKDVDAWQAKYGAVDSAAMSPYISESFGGYNYSKKAISTYANGLSSSGWQGAFASRLNAWRKI